MLEMKTQCEKCDSHLLAAEHAYICAFECTFCQQCTDLLDSICPNCSGELVRRPAKSILSHSYTGQLNMKFLIETPRLGMRKFSLEDIDAVFEFGKNLEVAHLTGDPVYTDKSEAEDVIRNIWLAEYEKYGYARYALVHKTDNKVIGFCGVKFEPHLNGPDIGYRMLPEYWGQGLATEATKATLVYASSELGLNKIVGEVLVEHTASSNVLLKSGFEFVKTYSRDGFVIHQYVWKN